MFGSNTRSLLFILIIQYHQTFTKIFRRKGHRRQHGLRGALEQECEVFTLINAHRYKL